MEAGHRLSWTTTESRPPSNVNRTRAEEMRNAQCAFLFARPRPGDGSPTGRQPPFDATPCWFCRLLALALGMLAGIPLVVLPHRSLCAIACRRRPEWGWRDLPPSPLVTLFPPLHKTYRMLSFLFSPKPFLCPSRRFVSVLRGIRGAISRSGLEVPGCYPTPPQSASQPSHAPLCPSGCLICPSSHIYICRKNGARHASPVVRKRSDHDLLSSRTT